MSFLEGSEDFNDESNEPGPPPEVIAELHQKQSKPNGYSPIPFTDLIQRFPGMRPTVIDGILRQGETLNIIAPPKTGKSFLVGGLAWCVATGRPWLSHDVKQCKVLVVDNELHNETLASRYDRIAFDMQIEDSERSGLEVVSLRGENVNINNAEMMLRVPEGKYGLIVFDALYRMLPEETNENSNAQMMLIYNKLDQLAKSWGAAVVVIHHASKGDQSEKSVTDVGAGAGSISRAADSHLIIRPHEQQGLHVLEAVTRSFPSPDPVSIRFTYPLWQAETIEPQIKTRKSGSGEAKQLKWEEDKQSVFDAIPTTGEVTQSKVRSITGHRQDRVVSLIAELAKDQRVKIREEPGSRKGQVCYFYSRGCTEASTEASTAKNAYQGNVQA
ncbi:MAG: AAA family ATPase [Planctomycetota bacterium]|jgi:hypothetical protein